MLPPPGTEAAGAPTPERVSRIRLGLTGAAVPGSLMAPLRTYPAVSAISSTVPCEPLWIRTLVDIAPAPKGTKTMFGIVCPVLKFRFDEEEATPPGETAM